MITKQKRKNIIIILIFLISLIGFIYSTIKIINYKIDEKETINELQIINDIVIIKKSENTNNIIIIDQKEEINKEDPYWDYINMDLIDVSFDKLKEINNDTKGWIQINNTNVNYPFVQSNNNNYYLTHSFDKSKNSAGWVYLDYRNNINSDDKNTILYAHGRLDKTMFGSLRNILTNGWLNDKNNFVIKLSTEYDNSLWQIFSIYKIPTTNDYIQITFNDNNEFLEFINKIKNRSKYNFDVNISEDDKILTLSTCYNKTDKIVLHAKLIKQELKKAY